MSIGERSEDHVTRQGRSFDGDDAGHIVRRVPVPVDDRDVGAGRRVVKGLCVVLIVDLPTVGAGAVARAVGALESSEGAVLVCGTACGDVAGAAWRVDGEYITETILKTLNELLLRFRGRLMCWNIIWT